jgi:hypothetical protein
MRTFFITFKIPDSDFAESEFDKVLAKEFGSAIVDYIKLIDHSELYNKDSFFKKIEDNYKKVKKVRNNYIQKHG